MVWEWQLIFLFIFSSLELGHLDERITWFMLFLNKHQIVFETKSKFNFSIFILVEKILVKEMNWVYEIMQSCKGVFVSF
jgi:hypothetical protein